MFVSVTPASLLTLTTTVLVVNLKGSSLLTCVCPVFLVVVRHEDVLSGPVCPGLSLSVRGGVLGEDAAVEDTEGLVSVRDGPRYC